MWVASGGLCVVLPAGEIRTAGSYVANLDSTRLSLVRKMFYYSYSLFNRMTISDYNTIPICEDHTILF